ncbi:hypothetical protein BB14905_22188 [Bacillus sp. B14905]|nr:hypothetical protein BB14905_22188 [Bacillus sp. B14905]
MFGNTLKNHKMKFSYSIKGRDFGATQVEIIKLIKPNFKLLKKNPF